MSTIISLADALVAHINAGAFSKPVAAVRMFQPAHTLQDLRDLRVTVVPRGIEISAASRDSSAFECSVDVGVQQRITADGDSAQIDALLLLVEEIADHIRLKRLPMAPDAAWVRIAHEPIVAGEPLEQHRVFTSVLGVTYRVRR